jgi:RNA polymerase sigma-70 factor (ECF subfamily)
MVADQTDFRPAALSIHSSEQIAEHRPAPGAGMAHGQERGARIRMVQEPATNPPGARALTLEREASLRARLCARDEQALVELVDVATPWLLGVAQAVVQDADEAEEVVLDAFRIAWEKVTPDAGGERGLMPWLLQIVRHRAIDRVRMRRRRVARVERAHAGGALGEAAAPAPPIDEAGQPGWHVHRSVHDALAALPVEQHDVVRLAYFEGLTHSEIAERLGVPLGTVKTRLRLAFAKLRVALAPIKDWVP